MAGAVHLDPDGNQWLVSPQPTGLFQLLLPMSYNLSVEEVCFPSVSGVSVHRMCQR